MSPKVHRSWKYGAIILAFIAISSTIEAWRTKKSVRQLFTYNIELTVVDADSGKLIEHYGTESPTMSSTDIFPQTCGFSAGTNGKQTISGIGYEPRKWVIYHQDYKRTALIVDEDTPNVLEIQLKPLVSK